MMGLKLNHVSERGPWSMTADQGLYLVSDKNSYHKILWSLAAVIVDVNMIHPG